MVALSRTGDVSHIRTYCAVRLCPLKRRPAEELDRKAGKKLSPLAIGGED